jgi:hypothetical protein
MQTESYNNIGKNKWLLYSKDTTTQGDFALINAGLLDCP